MRDAHTLGPCVILAVLERLRRADCVCLIQGSDIPCSKMPRRLELKTKCVSRLISREELLFFMKFAWPSPRPPHVEDSPSPPPHFCATGLGEGVRADGIQLSIRLSGVQYMRRGSHGSVAALPVPNGRYGWAGLGAGSLVLQVCCGRCRAGMRSSSVRRR